MLSKLRLCLADDALNVQSGVTGLAWICADGQLLAIILQGGLSLCIDLHRKLRGPISALALKV